MRSVTEVFGLDERRLPTADEIDRVLAGQRVDGSAPRLGKGNGEPFSDATVQGARRRFLAAYDLPTDAELAPQHVENMKAGRSATGRFLDTGDVQRKLTAIKAPVSYIDCIWSADKSVTACWALAPSEAERSIILQAHRTAVATAMAYVETHLGFMTKGRSGKDGEEKGTVAWLTCDHYTSRPTAEIAMTDKNGQAYTEFQTIPMRIADPQLHSHALLLNAVLTNDTGRMGAMDRDKLDGLIKEFGGVYQADLARSLRASGIDARLDPETGAARIMDVPAYVTRHLSKRSQDIEAAAHRYAKEEGLDWDSMTPQHQLKFMRKGVEETRQPKREHDGDSDFTLWRKQVADEIGYTHRSVLRPGQEQDLRPAAIRHQHAYEVSLPLIEKALSQKAKLGAEEFREAAARGLIEAGIGNPGEDIKAVMSLYREQGVRQDGEMTPILFGKDIPKNGKERWSVTTAMHVDDERTVIDLAKKFSADHSAALSHGAIERASQAFLASNPQIDPASAQWVKQREVVEVLGTGGKLGIAVGVAGAGKTTLITPLVSAMKEDGRHVYGIARGWKQADALRGGGVEQKDTAAVSVFLNREAKGRITVDSKSVVIIDELSQIGRRDMLELFKLQQKHGFTMLAIGDPKQAGSIDAPVMNLLMDTLGDKVPQILSSVRQKVAREREIAGLFRATGMAGQAIGMKLEDGTAELVAGGRGATIERVASKWIELNETDPTLRPTIGVASNRDAHDIGIVIRQKLQAAGKVGPDIGAVAVLMRGETGLQQMPLAEGDQVRVFNRIWVNGHFASNGDVLTVLDVSQDGMKTRNAAGTEAFVGWDALSQRNEQAPRLAYGHALTIDASQGITSRVHIDAMLSGSWQQQGGKGYVNESRHTETTLMIVNEAAERRKIFSRLPRGEYHPISSADVWKHVADNLDRPATKASATDFLRDGAKIYRGGLAGLAKGMEPAERREALGQERMTLRHRMERAAAEISPAIQRGFHYITQTMRDRAWTNAKPISQEQADQRHQHEQTQSQGLSL